MSIILRFIGAIILAIIASFAIVSMPLFMFGAIAHVIHHFGIVNLIIFFLVSSILSTIISFVAPLLMTGLAYTVRGSKFIAIVITLIFIRNFYGNCVLLLGCSDYYPQVLEIIKEDAGAYYQLGAIVTLIIMFLCYGFMSLFLFF